MNISLVEDDDLISHQITSKFQQHDYSVSAFSRGSDALERIPTSGCDVVVLDLMLPDIDGMQILEKLRDGGFSTPIIVLSAIYSVEKKVEALRSGANDYLVKPFAFDELLARVDILVFRNKQQASESIKLKAGELTLDLVKRRAKRDGKVIELLPKEFKFLELLMRNQGKCLTRSMLFEKVWNYNFDPKTNIIDVHMCRLRNKIDKGFRYQILHTDIGNGYTLRPLEEKVN